MTDTDYHKKFRDLIEHEDKLVADRNTWCVLSQSFLFISFALTLSALSKDLSTPNSAELAHTFHKVLISVGLALSFVTFVSIVAAVNAIGCISKSWEQYTKDLESTASRAPETAEKEPASDGSAPAQDPFSIEKMILTGGGNKFSSTLGTAAPFGVSIVFFCAWGFVGLQYWNAETSLMEMKGAQTECTTG